jgi:hypothetical protein
MAEDATEIVKRWRNNVAPEEPKEDVLKVVEAFFPASSVRSGKGSHYIIVEHEALRLAEQHGLNANFPGGKLSISHTKGKNVKAYLVKDLLLAIDCKEAFEKAREQRDT